MLHLLRRGYNANALFELASGLLVEGEAGRLSTRWHIIRRLMTERRPLPRFWYLAGTSPMPC